MNELHCPFLADGCDITSDFGRFAQADAVVYHIPGGVDMPRVNKARRPEQRFVFALWESPATFPGLQEFRKFFNWTMTFRLTSHIVTSYYSGNPYIHVSSDYYRLMIQENRTRKLNLKLIKKDDRPSDSILEGKKLGTAAALISNCGGTSKRLPYITHLKRFIDIKVYGDCGTKCSKVGDCRGFIAKNYYFLLSFENSICTDYTSKFSMSI